MMSPPLDTQCSASYGVNSGGSSPPAGKVSRTLSNDMTVCPELSPKDGGATPAAEKPAWLPSPSRKRDRCSKELSLFLFLPRIVMTVVG
jgi:hypothetical protein